MPTAQPGGTAEVVEPADDPSHKKTYGHHHGDPGGGDHRETQGEHSQHNHHDSLGLGESLQPACFQSQAIKGRRGKQRIVVRGQGGAGGHGEIRDQSRRVEALRANGPFGCALHRFDHKNFKDFIHSTPWMPPSGDHGWPDHAGAPTDFSQAVNGADQVGQGQLGILIQVSTGGDITFEINTQRRTLGTSA